MDQSSYLTCAYAPYELVSNGVIKSYQNYSVRKGALLRFTFAPDCIGYADCHPWQELNDLCLDDQLTNLKQKKITPLLAQSIQFAKLDAMARQNKTNLLEGLPLPKGHFLLTVLNEKSYLIIQDKLQEGFTDFKIKLGKDIENETNWLIKILLDYDIKVALDFNCHLTKEQFLVFLKKISSVREKIYFFEDPFEGCEREDQTDYGIDKCVLQTINKHKNSVAVFKPAIQPLQTFQKEISNRNIMVTSYLDHPFGQVCAAYYTALLFKQNPKHCLKHGLLTHYCYLENDFSRHLVQKGPNFTPPKGTGFGFDEELQKLSWQLL